MAGDSEKKKAPLAAYILVGVAVGLLLMLLIGVTVL
jgi:hypothetical protein